jgi:HAE1 family hydrophobic/amphiphilic exporter-1
MHESSPQDASSADASPEALRRAFRDLHGPSLHGFALLLTVGQVKLFGTADYAMRVWLQPDTLASRSLTVTDVIDAIKAQNVVNAAGMVGAEPAPPGQEFTYNVTAQGRLVEAEQFGEIIVRANPDGSFVRLRDVARIELGAQTYMQIGRFQGKPASVMRSTSRPARTPSRPATR